MTASEVPEGGIGCIELVMQAACSKDSGKPVPSQWGPSRGAMRAVPSRHPCGTANVLYDNLRVSMVEGIYSAARVMCYFSFCFFWRPSLNSLSWVSLFIVEISRLRPPTRYHYYTDHGLPRPLVQAVCIVYFLLIFYLYLFFSVSAQFYTYYAAHVICPSSGVKKGSNFYLYTSSFLPVLLLYVSKKPAAISGLPFLPLPIRSTPIRRSSA